MTPVTWRPVGAIRDPAGKERGEPLRRLVGVGQVLPESVDLRPFVARIPSQRGNSCVGHSMAQALRVRAAFQGVAIDPSALGIYALARQLENPNADHLPDVGSYPYRALEAMQQWGVVARARYVDESALGAPVPVDVLEAGAVARVTGEYRLASTGSRLRLEIQTALASAYPVFYCQEVDDSYQRYHGGIWRGLAGASAGGHAQCLVGYTPDYVIVAGSWGRDFGENGFAFVAWSFIEASAHVYDFQVISMSPKAVR